MHTTTVKDKHLKLDQRKIDRVKKIHQRFAGNRFNNACRC